MTKSQARAKLVEELIKCNGDRKWSEEMVARIEAGTLTLASYFSDEIHKLAAIITDQ